jgi:hypothetical protein
VVIVEDDNFLVPEGLFENQPEVIFENTREDFEDDDCGDSCKL